jgi:F-type H+-transporting ATPase subunit b
MPQLSQLALVYQSQWFWLLLVLGAIYFFVGRGIVPKVEATVDERDGKIAADLADAQRLQVEAEASEEAWRAKMNEAHAEAQEVTAKAKAKAAQNVEKAVAKADAEIAEKTTAAEASLAKARDAALAEIEGVAAEAAQDIVVRLTGAKVTDAAAKKAVVGVMANA